MTAVSHRCLTNWVAPQAAVEAQPVGAAALLREPVAEGGVGVEARAQGGARLGAQRAEHEWGNEARARGANRQVLAATMAAAARQRRAVKSGAHDHQPVSGAGREAGPVTGGLVPVRDVARMYRHAVEDQDRRPAAEIQDDIGGTLGAGAGLVPAARPERALRAVRGARWWRPCCRSAARRARLPRRSRRAQPLPQRPAGSASNEPWPRPIARAPLRRRR